MVINYVVKIGICLRILCDVNRSKVMRPSKRVRHVSLGLSTSTEEETPDASPTLAAKEVTETPPPSNVEATSDSSAPVTHAAQSPPQTGPKAFEGMPVDQLMEEFDMVTAQQAALVAQLRARFSNERSQKSSRSYAQNLAEEKMALLVKVEQERADAAEYKASCHWAVKYLEGEVKQSFGDVVKCALARGKAKAMVPIFSRPRDILNPFALEREIPLKESLEAHAIRLAKKKGVKGKAILCGVGAAHIPRSDGVPVSVATVLPKDSELLGKLEEAGDAAYQVGRYPPFGALHAPPLSAACMLLSKASVNSVGSPTLVPASVSSAWLASLARYTKSWEGASDVDTPLLECPLERWMVLAPVEVGAGLERTSIEDTISKFESLRRAAYSPGILLFMRERALAYEFNDRGHPRRILLFYHRGYSPFRDDLFFKDFDQTML
ncbi:hypothetical protein Tco_1033035 [Tanacetum coccineum]|uniref:Uncharacterized protein n=1 Tax=Tanacetum coccineum TaxID=301880 RepID=A0ABQ5GDS0_9ASTR